MHGHQVVRSESKERAATKDSYPAAFDSTICGENRFPKTAIPIPESMKYWSNRAILRYHDRMHKELGDEKYYTEILGVENPWNRSKKLNLEEKIVKVEEQPRIQSNMFQRILNHILLKI